MPQASHQEHCHVERSEAESKHLRLPFGARPGNFRLGGDCPEAYLVTRLYRHIGMAAPGADFRRDRGATNDGYWLSPSEERRGDRQNRPRPFGLRGKLAHASFHPNTQMRVLGARICRPRSWSHQSLRTPPHLHPTNEDLFVGTPELKPIFSRNAVHPYMAIQPSTWAPGNDP